MHAYTHVYTNSLPVTLYDTYVCILYLSLYVSLCVYQQSAHPPKLFTCTALPGRYILQYAEQKGSRMFYETRVWYGETINGLKGRLTKTSPYVCMYACMFYVGMCVCMHVHVYYVLVSVSTHLIYEILACKHIAIYIYT